jgi:hypothetical protein
VEQSLRVTPEHWPSRAFSPQLLSSGNTCEPSEKGRSRTRRAI